MKEIKFRAWDKDAEYMVYSDKQYDTYFFEFADGLVRCFRIDEGCGSIHEPPQPISTELDNIMQYTGLKDKTGREIYEGDILINPSNRDDDDCIKNIVKWINTPYTAAFDFGSAPAAHLAEIIGDIYQNPELCTK